LEQEAVAAGQFREDLFYRLNVIQIRVPPLRERSEEIPLLAEYFMQRYSTLFGRENVTLLAETVHRLLRHRFPGNVRELENVIKSIIVLGDPDLRRSPLPMGTSSGAQYKISGPARTAATSLKDISGRLRRWRSARPCQGRFPAITRPAREAPRAAARNTT
jgi:DNA-binding NtrC family response regulator